MQSKNPQAIAQSHAKAAFRSPEGATPHQIELAILAATEELSAELVRSNEENSMLRKRLSESESRNASYVQTIARLNQQLSGHYAQEEDGRQMDYDRAITLAEHSAQNAACIAASLESVVNAALGDRGDVIRMASLWR